MSLPEVCFLFDNGSLRPGATLGLRAIAASLEKRILCPVRPVSVLHSSAVSPQALAGRPAELLEPALKKALADGLRSAVLLPLFFGPSAAVVAYVPQRVRALAAAFPEACLRHARWVVNAADSNDMRIARLLAERVRETCGRVVCAAGAGGGPGEKRPHVVLVDHGSPQPAVTAVRNHLGRQLAFLLGDRVRGVHVASMERRPGAEYAFNEPLLAGRLRQPPCDTGEVIVALQFFTSGRHAGPGGDIAAICEEAQRVRPGLRTCLTDPLGQSELLVDVLADRFNEAR